MFEGNDRCEAEILRIEGKDQYFEDLREILKIEDLIDDRWSRKMIDVCSIAIMDGNG
jgi:hypothetical protein